MNWMRWLAVLASAALAGWWLVVRPPFGQDIAYHDFADQRTLLGIPHCLNVLSNVPFLIVGVLGWRFVARSARVPGGPFRHPAERWPYLVLFAGVFFTGFGSAYYHLDPDNSSLVWDRLPMTIAFMGLVSAVVSERLHPAWGNRLLVPLVLFGVATVFYWHLTEQRGTGDLRPYYLVQFYPMLVIPLVLLIYPTPYTHGPLLFVVLALYGLAKLVEHRDAEIYLALGQTVSGHTLKHLLAALAAYVILIMLQKRTLGGQVVSETAT